MGFWRWRSWKLGEQEYQLEIQEPPVPLVDMTSRRFYKDILLCSVGTWNFCEVHASHLIPGIFEAEIITGGRVGRISIRQFLNHN